MFDLGKVEASSFDVLEQNWYGAHVDKVEWKVSAKGPEYLNVTWKLDNNRNVFSMLHVFNDNATARNIALGDIKKMVVAMGGNPEMTITSKEQLAEFILTVNCEIFLKIERSEQYGDKNTVDNYRVREEAAAAVDTSNMPF